MKLVNNRLVLWTCIVFVIVLLISPFIIWKMINETEANIIVLADNKQSMIGLEIVMENAKKVNSDGKLFSVNQVTNDFQLLDKHSYDLIYLSSMENGLTSEQFNSLKNFLIYKGGNIAVEHSVYDMTLSDTIRYELETLSNTRWTGWKGFAYTSDTLDGLPDWINALYLKRYKETFVPSESGVIFVNAFNDDIVVIDQTYLDSNYNSIINVTINNTIAANEYHDWFTVFDVVDDSEVEAQFNLNITSFGHDLLKQHGIPTVFPATITHSTNTYNMVTYAGEFSKIKDDNLLNNSVIQKLTNKNLAGTIESEPFWNVFKPSLELLLDQPFTQLTAQDNRNYIESDQFSYNTRSREGQQFIEVFTEDGWEPIVVKGINIGMGKPGYFPGEAAISEAQYFRWFKQIGDMNANSFRVYTLQSPQFYKALYEYNQIAVQPLYFFHGAWVVEEYIAEHENMFVDEITAPFYEEINYIIDAVYGTANIEAVPGHAHGLYSYDVSEYLLGWIVGIEFSGETVLSTNEKNIGMPQFEGDYFKTEFADPFEIWLAQALDFTASYEIDNYKKAHPVSFTNWPTTDIFNHPLEFNVREDMDKVDPNLVIAKENYLPGQFYSFHIYPYYPDFIDAEYSDYVDSSGKQNSYAGYLNALKEHLNIPSIITEFGMPASRGITHSNKLGRNQGGHSESSQGEHLVSMFNNILDENFGGALVFTWQDEWFKRTWNTMDYDNPDRRPYWSNYQTNEQYFGVLSFESGRYENAIHIDGNTNDWDVLNSPPLYEYDDSDGVQQLFVHHDARYLFLRLDYKYFSANDINTKVYFDTLINQGNTKFMNSTMTYEDGIEFILNINTSTDVELIVDSYYDSFYYMNEKTLRNIDAYDYVPSNNSGVYHPIRQILSAEYEGLTPNGELYVRPYEEIIAGKLTHGNSRQNSEDYNSIADYYINEETGVVEIRIPWQMLNFYDPSQKEAIKDLYASEEQVIYGEFVEGINLFVTEERQNKINMLPNMTKTSFDRQDIRQYNWTTWDHPPYHERLKSSYYDLQQFFE